MANVNIKVLIKRPTKPFEEVVFQSITASTDTLVIPRETAYTDIVNLEALQNDGFFRTGSTEVGAYGGGLTLPRTEKLMFLVKTGTADKTTITFEKNKRVGFGKDKIELPAGNGKIYEIDLYDLGVMNDEKGNTKITFDKNVSVCLIARF